jgi:hypothetical protein
MLSTDSDVYSIQHYTITALEWDQYEEEAEFNIVVLCSIKPHIDQVQV